MRDLLERHPIMFYLGGIILIIVIIALAILIDLNDVTNLIIK
ncbi:MAG: hypothetical protein AB7E61_03300 [Acholeplasmataceae bacterium]